MYKEMIQTARQNGVANEKTMWASIEAVDSILEDIKQTNPDAYWQYIRDAHAAMYDNHYDETFAKYDIGELRYTDAQGVKHEGAHWTKEEVLTAWQGKAFPAGTTSCDKWVAANAMYADLCKKFDDQQVLDAAFLFYFADEDWDGDGKVWEYMSM